MRSTGSGTELRGWLRGELARLLGVAPDDVHDDDRFAAQGLDSLGATALARALSDTVGRTVSPALLWAYPSITELAHHLDHLDQPDTTEPLPAGRVSDARDEPVAVVGMACRFPGANSVAEFWSLLTSGADAVRPVPPDRWLPDPALAPVEAGFLTGPVDEFDPLFFGISPREAVEIDPQQRLFLEVAWEALADAGLANDALRGSRAGVFAGAIWHDYADLHGTDVTRLSPHSATGQALNMVANRLSYVLGLRGPSMTLDSACSSSLLAVHLACASLRAGESDTAIAGGVNLLLSQATMVALTRFGGLAPDGRCKAFDASGDGFGRGEGCGVVVLKRLSRALADGDRIWCLIRGSAVNNDGPSNGLTAPNPLAQEEVLRAAYQRAGVSSLLDVRFVETHGTGTALGDPIEAAALGAVLGAGRPADAPLVIGSVKTNLGHLEGAAGIAGLIKTALCVWHGGLPPNVHFRQPNPHIDFAGLRLRVPTSYQEWPSDRRLAGVSSFGWGGTNVHVVLDGCPEPAPLPDIPVKAVSEVVGARTAFVCSPHGHQWVGMGRVMLRTEPVFRAVLERCDRELARYTGWSLLDELFAAEDHVRHDDVAVTQPVLFAVQVALAAWLESRGVRPDAVVGHSLGEITAAVVAGMLDIPEAVRLVYHYSRQQQRISGQGEGMAVIELSAAELAEIVAAQAPGIVVATHNGPRSTALAGDVPTLERLVAGLKARGVLCAMIRVNVAAHSPAIDRITADLIADIGELAVAPGRIPMISTVTGQPLAAADLDAAYFARNLREPVLLAEATALLLATGHDVLVELSANPVLLSALRQSAADAGGTATVLGTMTRGEDDRAGVWDTLRELDRLGVVRPEREPAPAELFTLSAMTPAALLAAADAVADTLRERPSLPMADLATTANRGADHPYRLAVVARTSAELADLLRDSTSDTTGRSRAATRPKVAFVFPGQGSQWLGMGRDLLAREPVFAAAIRQCDAAAARFVDWSILAELSADDASSRLDRIDVIQPVLFAMEVALARLWQSWGVRPAAVVGHSMGEVATAYIAGAISLVDAARVVCLRSRLMRRASGRGAMLAVELTVAEAADVVRAWPDRVSVAVSNSRSSTVLSGDREALATIAEELGRREVFCRWVKVDVASHSPQMDALRDDLLAMLDGVTGRPPAIPMYSTVTGRPGDGVELDADYWNRNLRMPVLFADQIENLARSGHTVFVEMSPHPILLPAVRQVAMDVSADADADVTVLPSLRRGEPARDVLLDSLGALYVLGVAVDRQRATTPGRRISGLPPYPWQRERYRIERDDPPAGSSRSRGSLLTDRLDSAIEPGTHYWRAEFDPRTDLGDHVVGGAVIVPGSAYVDIVVRAAREVVSDAREGALLVTGLRFRRPLVVGATGHSAQVTLVREEPSGSAWVRIFDTDAKGVADARVSAPGGEPGEPLDVGAAQRRLAEDGTPGADHYARVAEHGLSYGPAFQRIRRIAHTRDDAVARLDAPPRTGDDHVVHPALLDAAIQVALAPALDPEWGLGTDTGLISAGIERTVVHRPLVADCYVRAVVRPSGAGFRADVFLYDLAGQPLVAATGITLRRSSQPVARHAGTPAPDATDAHGESRTTGGPIPAPVRDSLRLLSTVAERLAAVETVTRECVATVARMPAARIDPDMPLRALGIDSLMAMELRNQIEARFGATLSAGVIWAHPTVRQLAPLVARRAGIPLHE